MNQNAAPAWTIQGSRTKFGGFIQQDESNPGPIYYPESSHHGPEITIPRSSIVSCLGENNDVPGPGSYNPLSSTVKFSGPSFPKQKEQENKSDTPGVGLYDEQSFNIKNRMPSYTLGYKYDPEPSANIPGPGHYESQSHSMSRASNFPKQPRFKQSREKSPGPSDYELLRPFSSGKVSIGKSRRSLEQIPVLPGPGDYTIQPEIPVGVGKSIGKKIPVVYNHSETGKAFANYNPVPLEKNKLAFTIGKSRRSLWVESEIPGPTDYKPFQSAISERGPKFPKSKITDKTAETPGPGEYQTRMSKSTGFSIPKSKSLVSVSYNPGVGRYTPEKALESCRPRSTSHKIGKSKRINFISTNIAGVGDYDVIEKKIGGVTIPRAERFPKKNNDPGPGDYHLGSTLGNWTLYRKKK